MNTFWVKNRNIQRAAAERVINIKVTHLPKCLNLLIIKIRQNIITKLCIQWNDIVNNNWTYAIQTNLFANCVLKLVKEWIEIYSSAKIVVSNLMVNKLSFLSLIAFDWPNLSIHKDRWSSKKSLSPLQPDAHSLILQMSFKYLWLILAINKCQ